ncbi:hypothetical protein NPIL_454951 [Nephila pilipes]|uniref:Uncharacterized protein n=1 Tax=Nephila pilipes TaxID=299642 RepID=A0A8X6P5K0_NEPPI|nr:hypothetical protein NPIL_454951 [Nephila pilipes]
MKFQGVGSEVHLDSGADCAFHRKSSAERLKEWKKLLGGKRSLKALSSGITVTSRWEGAPTKREGQYTDDSIFNFKSLPIEGWKRLLHCFKNRFFPPYDWEIRTGGNQINAFISGWRLSLQQGRSADYQFLF